jgi:glycerate 2-kinase
MYPFIKKTNGVFISFGTDGIDGPTNAAGAVIDMTTIKESEFSNLIWKKYLDNNDAYNFFKKTRNLIITGPTGTNVADIQIFLKNKKPG